MENLSRGQKVLNIPFAEGDIWVHLKGSNKAVLFLIRGKRFVGKEEFDLSGASFEDWLYAYYSVNYIPQRVFLSGKIENIEYLRRYLEERSRKGVEVIEKIPEGLKELIEANLPSEVDGETVQLFEEVLKIPFPKRIEGFDISHFGGEGIVGSCVVWENGTMNKRCYRKYRIKTVEGIDDYKALKEVLTRRAKRIKKGQYPTPDIWLIDGGKGQLNIGVEVKRRFGLKTFVVSLAKREEILFTEDGRQIPLKEYPPLYRIFGFIRDEAHRFAVGYNRKLRELKILGKLPERERKILERNFGSVYELLETPDERLKRLGLDPALKQEIKKHYGEV